MTNQQLLDRSRGCLLGGAIGDALGYEVEFISLAAIKARYATGRIERYSAVPAHFSDDTQMTLFTAEGLINAHGHDFLKSIRRSYLDWYATQTEPIHPLEGSAIAANAGLWARRAPGNTCMSALSALQHGFEVKNDSKGCGGVMRVAPIGLYAAAHPELLTVEGAGRLAAEAAEITHLHPASSLASALMAMIVAKGAMTEEPDLGKISDTILACLETVIDVVACELKNQVDFSRLIMNAIDLALSKAADEDAIRRLGEGWVGDEAIAIAIYAAVRHFDSFENCIIAAANHDGDSDSTAAIAGNILGAFRGISVIPDYYIDGLEMTDVLESTAGKLVE